VAYANELKADAYWEVWTNSWRKKGSNKAHALWEQQVAPMKTRIAQHLDRRAADEKGLNQLVASIAVNALSARQGS